MISNWLVLFRLPLNNWNKGILEKPKRPTPLTVLECVYSDTTNMLSWCIFELFMLRTSLLPTCCHLTFFCCAINFVTSTASSVDSFFALTWKAKKNGYPYWHRSFLSNTYRKKNQSLNCQYRNSTTIDPQMIIHFAYADFHQSHFVFHQTEDLAAAADLCSVRVNVCFRGETHWLRHLLFLSITYMQNILLI